MPSYEDLGHTTSMRWLPDPRVAPHAKEIEERVGKFASQIRPATFAEYLDPLARRLISDALRDAKAHEGVVWLLDREGKNLLCAYQAGPHSSRLNNIRVPVEAGVAGMVLVTQQPFSESNLGVNRAAASTLEDRMGVIVCSRALVPLVIAGVMRGLVAAYRTKPKPDAAEPAGFTPEAVEALNLLSRILGRLMDHKLLCAAIGLEED
jgi:GAF domain-containing protein